MKLTELTPKKEWEGVFKGRNFVNKEDAITSIKRGFSLSPGLTRYLLHNAIHGMLKLSYVCGLTAPETIYLKAQYLRLCIVNEELKRM